MFFQSLESWWIWATRFIYHFKTLSLQIHQFFHLKNTNQRTSRVLKQQNKKPVHFLGEIHEKLHLVLIPFITFRFLWSEGHFAFSTQLRAIYRHSITVPSGMVQLQHGTDGVKPFFHGSKENAKDSTIQLFLTPARIQLLDVANLHLLFCFISSVQNQNLHFLCFETLKHTPNWWISMDGKWLLPFPETFSATMVSKMESKTQLFNRLKPESRVWK